MSQVRIRPLKTHEEFRECERIQKTVWGALSVANEVMIPTQKFGGALLGAFLAGRMVGFICAFLGRRNGQLIHWSHMMAVAPGFRDRGLGLQMKFAHRRLALEQGLKSICWTYDPLQSRNATLNIFRLGARVEEFIPNLYGHFPSRIEKGLPSDRFLVDWRIASRAVERRLKARLPGAGPKAQALSSTKRRLEHLSLPRVNETRLSPQGLLENQRISLHLREPRLLVEIPPNTDAIRARSIEDARRWRMQSRRIFRAYLSAGYRVEEFVPRARTQQVAAFTSFAARRR